MTDVKIRMTAEDAASPAINKVKQSLTGFANSQGIMGGIVGGLIGGGMMGVANAAIQAAAAIPQAVGEMANMAMQAERTEAAFVTLSGSVGESSNAMLASLRELTGGTISDTELMLSANRAMMLGVSDNAEEIGKLMAAAIERGRALGISSAQAVDNIMTGIGRESALILDNLGIVGVQTFLDDYAKSLGKVADELTGVERKQALVNAVIAQGSGGGVIDDAASAFERMDASIKNMQEALGKLFGPAIAGIAQNLADAANATANVIDFTAAEEATTAYMQKLGELRAAQEQLTNLSVPAPIDASAAHIYDEVAAAERELIAAGVELGSTSDTTRAALEAKIAALQADATAAFNAAMEAQGLSAQTAMTRTEFDASGWAAWRFAGALDAVGVSALNAGVDIDALMGKMRNSVIAARESALSGVFGALGGTATGLMDNMGTDASLDWLKKQKAEMGAMYDQLASQTETLADGTTVLKYTNAEIQLILQGSVAETNKWATGLDKVSSGATDAEKAFEKLKDRVSSMLQGALSPDVSIADGLLPREDDINENARRLAAIANEGIGDQSWMEEFKTELPALFDEIVSAADPKAAAAKIFQEFQAGLRPELIDKGLVKERIKAMITGEQEMSALATEIANELAAEMGVSLPQAMAAAQSALGVSSTGGGATADGTGAGTVTGVTIKPTFDLTDVRATGTAAGLEFSTGMDATGVANKFSTTFMLAMKEFYGRFYASGAASASEYSNGFLTQFRSSVPVEIVLALATLVTPEVLRILASQGSAEGAQ